MSMKYTPHDELFKHVMGHPETAKNFIREYLPEDIVDKVDLSHFQDKTEKYTDEKMDEYRTDLVFNTRLEEGQDAYFYFLFEHKSSPDRNTVFQLLRYMTLIWEKAFEEEEEYPVILPILFYHGESVWSYGESLDEILTNIPGWADDFTPYFDYQVYETHKSEKESDDPLFKAYTLLLEAAQLYDEQARIVNAMRKALKFFDKAVEKFNISEEFEYVFRYIIAAIDLPPHLMQKIVNQEVPERREEFMAMAEKLREEGRKEGKKEGSQDTLNLMKETIKKMKNKFGSDKTIDLVLEIEDSDVKKLEEINTAIEKADSVEELKEMIR